MSDPRPDSGDRLPEEADGRPIPQYGEYASPEEQRARIRQPEASFAIEAGHTPEPAPVAARKAAASQPASTGRGRRIDRIVTIALLVYGLLNVVVTAPRMFALADGADGYFGLVGLDEPLADTAGARLWGAVAGSVLIVGWIATAWLSWVNLRHGRLSFWIPLVGAVVTSVLTTLIVFVPALGDPVFLEFLERFAPAAG